MCQLERIRYRATAMFQQNVPERVIQKVTGHRSLDALRAYEKISVEQHKNVSKLIMTNSDEATSSASCDDKKATGFLGGCSVGTITFNFNSNLQ